jgi:hypothetical protein
VGNRNRKPASIIACCLILISCAASSERAEIDRICRQNETDMRCAKKQKQPTRKEMQKDHVEICVIRGSTRDCYWARRGDLDRILRGM